MSQSNKESRAIPGRIAELIQEGIEGNSSKESKAIPGRIDEPIQ
jgi:hypothetical protein